MNDLVPGARVQVKVHKGKAMPKSDVLKAAEDITKVIEDGKDDDASVKNIIAGSKTHGGIVPPPPPPHLTPRLPRPASTPAPIRAQSRLPEP